MILLRTGHTETLLHDYVLEPNYANPFNPSTLISFSNTNAARITIQIFNTLGQTLRTGESSVSGAGRYVFFEWLRWAGKAFVQWGRFCRFFSEGNCRQIKIELSRRQSAAVGGLHKIHRCLACRVKK